MRKPIGIFATKTTYPEYAVICDDSSIWIWNCNIRIWERLPDIPQDEPEQPATSPDRAVDMMRRDARRCIREVLKRIDGQEEPR